MKEKNEKPKSFTLIERIANWRANRAENKAIKKQIKGLEKDMKGSVSSFQKSMEIWNSQKLPCGHRWKYEPERGDSLVSQGKFNEPRTYRIQCRPCKQTYSFYNLTVDSNNVIIKIELKTQ